MNNKRMKRYSIPSVVKEMQLKSTMSIHSIQ